MIDKTSDQRLTRRYESGSGVSTDDRALHHASPRITEARYDGSVQFHRPAPLVAVADAEHSSGYDSVYGWY